MGQQHRGIIAPPDVQRGVAALVRELGINGAARALGIGREQALRIVGRYGVRVGTIAVARDALARREHAQTRGGHDAA